MIQTQQLTKKYGNYFAVNNVSMSVQKGDIYGLIGKNGAGKTTIFKLLMGLIKPSGGSITFLESYNLEMARHSIGFMMEDGFFSYLNAHDNLMFAAKLKGIEDEKEINRILQLVGLKNSTKTFSTFSTGMKQRLSIGQALLGNPDMVILDEPTNGLDPQGIADFRNLVMELNQKYQTTFLISSHILGELNLIGTRFGFINKGYLVQEISAKELHNNIHQGLIFQVNKLKKACELLENKLKITDYRVTKNKEIILPGYEDRPHIIAKCMVENGLDLIQLKVNQVSLEEYFLNLIGGNTNV